MHRPCAYPQNQQIDFDFDSLYRTYWKRVVQFCAKSLASLPEGTAEEVAQDVFLAAYHALINQRYRGDGATSSWLFGIARNLCGKVRRDTYRKTTSRRMRQLEREIDQLEQQVLHLMHEPAYWNSEQVRHIRERLNLARVWLDRERDRLQQNVQECAHLMPTMSLDAQFVTYDPAPAMHTSFRRFARRDRQAHALLHMHVIKETAVQDIAALQGMSRSAVYRSLSRAKAELRTMYEAAMHELDR